MSHKVRGGEGGIVALPANTAESDGGATGGKTIFLGDYNGLAVGFDGVALLSLAN